MMTRVGVLLGSSISLSLMLERLSLGHYRGK